MRVARRSARMWNSDNPFVGTFVPTAAVDALEFLEQAVVVKLVVLNRAMVHSAHTPALVVDVQERRSETRLVAHTRELVPTLVIEAVFSGASGVSCVVVRDGARREISASTLQRHPAATAVLRLIADELELRRKVARIAFGPRSQQEEERTDRAAAESETLLESLLQILSLYIARGEVSEVLPTWGRPIRDRQIERALLILNSDIAKRWTVESLAKAVGLSRAAFARRFRAVLELSPMRYLAQRRLQAAAALLFASDASLAEVAVRVGYDSEFAFSRAFKRHTGLPPGEYRRRVTLRSSNVIRMAA
jgi:AraC-like DNA-binding protein